MKEYILQVFENKFSENILTCENEERDFKRLHNKEAYNLYSPPLIIMSSEIKGGYDGLVL
jgi:hypothetical protein